MKLSFRQRLFIYFALLFTVFATGIAVFEHSREKNFKTLILEERLGIYTNIIQTAITDTTTNYESALDKVHSYLPAQLRISVIAQQGNVLYDNTVKDVSKMENHAGRVEIRTAEINGTGSDIRESATKHMPYFYYARKIQSGFIRVALPDDVQMRQFLKADNLFLYFLLGLFVISIFIIHSITSQVGASIKRLRDFALSPDRQDIVFGEDELGETGKKISENYLQLESGRKDLWQVKNKLLQHILISGEGICFFSNNKQVEFYNALFIQYLHQLIDEPHSDVSAVFSDDIFADFLEVLEKSNETTFETQLKKNGKTFSFRANLFDDKSIEVILSDVTKQEKTRQLKVEMTGNIAHELRTPVTSIRAYLETIIRQNLSEEQQLHFITKAYAQSLTLSEMIRDMSVLAKLEEAPQTFGLETIKIEQLLTKLKEESAAELLDKHIHMEWQLPEGLLLKGNTNLVNAVFRNLIENTIRYAGENISINISVYHQDKDYYYFRYYDTGCGIKDEYHLNRLFERFYRVDEGRTRNTGGSGLGLSIVKNAILFHKGSISVKNRKSGGLEFLFQLHK
ncbi:MAG TPA: ATP-binding protein [Saprospiraceae bacterium]|nr:hypothetical protein [Saprospiraceae bacterium]MCC6688289.1 two-component sensor histidine kinase [Saprospiraceae bacterium]HMX83451.1 ATP-binding protein [Saprospiraceae bacterium]HMX84793.1 ATP-binding protein [Saprospiraceae bacterium]HMZ73313.1 ATP-binding protein [Saprospiraceae bacterium]